MNERTKFEIRRILFDLAGKLINDRNPEFLNYRINGNSEDRLRIISVLEKWGCIRVNETQTGEPAIQGYRHGGVDMVAYLDKIELALRENWIDTKISIQ